MDLVAVSYYDFTQKGVQNHTPSGESDGAVFGDIFSKMCQKCRYCSGDVRKTCLADNVFDFKHRTFDVQISRVFSSLSEKRVDGFPGGIGHLVA